MALEVYLYLEPSFRSSAYGSQWDIRCHPLDDQDCGCTGTTHDVVYLPKPLRAGRHEVLDK